MEFDWTAIAVPILSASIFGLVGFVWRWSHKVTKLEQDIESLRQKVRKLERDHDKVMDRMYSMVRSGARIR